MARNMSNLELKGNVGDLSFYGDGLVRKKRDPIDKKVFATKPSLRGMYNKSEEFGMVAKGTKVLKDGVRLLFQHAKDGTLHNRISSILNKIKNSDEISVSGSMTISNGLKNPLGRHLLRGFVFTPGRTVFDTIGGEAVYDSDQHSYTISEFSVGNVLFPRDATHVEVGLFILNVDFERGTHTTISGPSIFIDREFRETNFTLQASELPEKPGIFIMLVYVRFYLELEGRKYIIKDELGIDMLGVEFQSLDTH